MKYLYIIHNNINEKKYVGVSIRPEERFKQHKNREGCPALHSAIKKYGEDNFSMELLCVGDAETIDQLEIEAIQLFNSVSPNGYNIAVGGQGGRDCVWTDAEDKLLETKNNTEVAELVGRCRDTVARRRKQLGIDRIPQDFSHLEFKITEEVEAIFKDINLTIGEAAKKAGCGTGMVSDYRKEYNIKLSNSVRNIEGGLVRFELTDYIKAEYKEGNLYPYFKDKYGISRSLYNKHRQDLKLSKSNVVLWTEEMTEVVMDSSLTTTAKAKKLGLNWQTVDRKLRKLNNE